MERIILAIFSVAALLTAPRAVQHGKGVTEETLRYENFGVLHLYRTSPHPANVVVIFSGDDGWNARVADVAVALASLDSLVVGIDTPHYLESLVDDGEKCSYYSGDVEDLSHYVQQRIGFPHYIFPILVGYGSGATLVYAALVQTPTGALRGGMSLGFCPSLRLPKVPCRGNGLEWTTNPKGQSTSGRMYVFRPARDLAIPWTVLHGDADKVCDSRAVQSFGEQTGSARIISLPGVGHGFSMEADWMPQLKREFTSLVHTLEAQSSAPAAPDVKDLPLVEIPASGSTSDALAIIISGDGGWAGIDRDLGKTLAGSGISVVGLNSLQYFWTRRTPDTAAADLTRILRHYLASWNKRRVILAGYSMGADVLPFMASRLPADLLSRVAFIALLGPSPTVDFEFHFVEWLGGISRRTDFRVAPEIEKLQGKQILCFFGVEEKDSLCRMLSAGLVVPVAMKDGHHFGGDYAGIAGAILKEIKPQNRSLP